MLPLAGFGPVSAPWFQAQVPGHGWCSRTFALGFRYCRLSTALAASPPAAFASRLRSPFPGLRHCFRSLCAGVVRPRALVCTPPLARFGRVRAPWFQAQAPGHFYSSSRCAGLGAHDFPQSPLLPIGRFHLADPLPFPGLRHCFRSLCAGVVRPRAMVCTPPLSRIGPSQSPLVISPGPSASLLSAGDFPRERLSNPVVRLSPHGSQDPRGPCNASRPALPAAC